MNGLGAKHAELSDEELMVLYQNDDVKAFNVLYARYSGKVYAYLRKRLQDESAAHDVFQAAFLKLHHSRGQFDPTFAFAPWLFTVTRTVMLDWLKQTRTRTERIALTDPSEAEESQTLSGNEPPAGLDLSELAHLPEAQRRAIELRYVDDLEFEEIAKRLKTSPVNVRKLVSRGLKTMRDFLRTQRES